MRSFDRISSIYDLLTCLVFAGKIRKANTEYAQDIKSGMRLLIIGGGSGVLLKYLKEGVQVDFVDASRSMVGRAKKRQTGASVRFHPIHFEDFRSDQTYDMVICPFFLDLFPQNEQNSILEKINGFTHPQSRLWISDFIPSEAFNRLHRFIFFFMRWFFIASIHLNISSINSIDAVCQTNGWNINKASRYYFKMIFSRLYLKK